MSMGFPMQYWRGLSFPTPWDLPDLGIKPCLLPLLHWLAGFLPLCHLESLLSSPPLFKLSIFICCCILRFLCVFWIWVLCQVWWSADIFSQEKVSPVLHGTIISQEETERPPWHQHWRWGPWPGHPGVTVPSFASLRPCDYVPSKP